MIDHVLYISSWYPQARKSNGTFIEMQLIAAGEAGVKAAVLQTEVLTAGNYLRKRLRGESLFNYRPHEQVYAVENLAVHRLPLRYSTNPDRAGAAAVISAALRNAGNYMREHGRPDAFFHHGIFDFCYLTAALSEHFDIPYWFMEHSAFVDEGTLKSRNAFESESDLRDFVIGASRRFAVTGAYARRFSRMFDVPFEFAPNVLSSDFFAKSPELRSHPPFTFLNVGILEPHKNQALLLEAFAAAFRDDGDVRLTIAGDGRLGPELAAKAEALGIAGQTRFPGFVNRQELRRLLDSSHVFVLSSKLETFGVVLIEAMARGLPVVAPDIDGPRELINGDNGILFRADDAARLAEQMILIKETYFEYNPSRIASAAAEIYGPDALKTHVFYD